MLNQFHSLSPTLFNQIPIKISMPFPDVIKRGEDFFNQYPRDSKWWKFLHYSTCVLVIGMSKIVLNLFYKVKVHNYQTLQKSLNRSKSENRGLLTIMNHMSTVDDPFLWATFPMSLYKSLSNIRFCLGAHNICFKNKFLSTFFSLGGVLSTERFGKGPFQGSIDCGIKILSPNNTLNDNNKVTLERSNSYSSWVHAYPEGFVLQLHPPYNNSMRYFKWGVTRMILEAAEPPIVVPIFTTGFEKIASEDETVPSWKHFLSSWGTQINVTIGEPIDDSIIESYRREWQTLISKYSKPNDTDLNDTLKFGEEAQDLRSRLASELRSKVSEVRILDQNLKQEDPRFQDHRWWKVFTQTEGKSDPDVKLIGQNWAIRRLHNFLHVNKDFNIKDNEVSKENNPVNKDNSITQKKNN